MDRTLHLISINELSLWGGPMPVKLGDIELFGHTKIVS